MYAQVHEVHSVSPVRGGLIHRWDQRTDSTYHLLTRTVTAELALTVITPVLAVIMCAVVLVLVVTKRDHANVHVKAFGVDLKIERSPRKPGTQGEENF